MWLRLRRAIQGGFDNTVSILGNSRVAGPTSRHNPHNRNDLRILPLLHSPFPRCRCPVTLDQALAKHVCRFSHPTAQVEKTQYASSVRKRLRSDCHQT